MIEIINTFVFSHLWLIAFLISFASAALWWGHILNEFGIQEWNPMYEPCINTLHIYSAIGFSLVFLLLMILKGFSII